MPVRSTKSAVILGVMAVACIALVLLLWVITSPLTGVGVKIEQMPAVDSFSLTVDERTLKRAETALLQLATEQNLKSSRLEIPVDGRQSVHLQLSASGRSVVTASNFANARRLDIRISSTQSRASWEPLVRDVKTALERALDRRAHEGA